VDGEDPAPSIVPYLRTILSLANVSEPLFKLIYVQHVSLSPSLAPNINSPPIFVSPTLQPHVAENSDHASSAAESLFFRVVDHLKTKNPLLWVAEEPGEASGSGDVFSELKVPMWPPLEGPREDEGGGDEEW
jgi:hypothetical protein